LNGVAQSKNHFHAHETARVDALDGMPLARFWQRALGFSVDMGLMLGLRAPVVEGWTYYVRHHLHGHTNMTLEWNVKDEMSLVFLLVYAAVANYLGNGQTPGKWVARTRIVSLTHGRMGPWQSFERALGYGASFLEAGFGFAQYFFIRNRQCVHDRIAETIVVDVRKEAKRLMKESAGEAEALP